MTKDILMNLLGWLIVDSIIAVSLISAYAMVLFMMLRVRRRGMSYLHRDTIRDRR